MNNLWITGAGEVIRNLRGKRPIGAVAKQLGITTSTLSLIERNMRRLSVYEIANFADIVGMPSKQIFALCLDKALPKFGKDEQILLSLIAGKLKGKS
jgi:transcriptional regulator with XRE-family HTH domain